MTGRQAIGPALAIWVAAAGAQPATVDGVVAVVNDDVVLASEVVERFDAVMTQIEAAGDGPVPPRNVVLEQILERLILENIQLQEAENRGVVLDDETLTTAVRSYASQNDMGIDEFIATLTQEGVSYRGFREQVRRQLTLERVQREVVNRRVYVTEQDVDDLLASPFFAEQISDEYQLGHILLALPQGATPSEAAATAETAAALVRELRDGADFAALAVEHSSASTALEGGDLGWRKASRIPSLFAEVAVELAVGEVAEPLRNASGFHVVKLLDKRGASVQRTDETLVRHILVRPSAIRTEAQAEAAVLALRQRILAGEDFAELAKEHSEDPASALAGGDLGWSAASAFVREFQEAMGGTDVGAVSPPFRTEFGWHILEVQGRRQQDAGDEARRDLAIRVLHGQRFEERLQEWLKEIRDEAFVEKRMRLAAPGGDAATAPALGDGDAGS